MIDGDDRSKGNQSLVERRWTLDEYCTNIPHEQGIEMNWRKEFAVYNQELSRHEQCNDAASVECYRYQLHDPQPRLIDDFPLPSHLAPLA